MIGGKKNEKVWHIHRILLERCTYTNNVLSDNSFHPEIPAWFADKLEEVSDHCGQTVPKMIEGFCSLEPIARAEVYFAIASYFGGNNFDQTPITFQDLRDVADRYSNPNGNCCIPADELKMEGSSA